MIALTSELMTGVAEIDAQHEELFKRINSVSLVTSQNEMQAAIERELEFLGSYIVEHFEDEEELQRKYEYPEHNWHKTMHQWYVAEFNKLKQEYDANGATPEFSNLLDHSITNWIVKHIGNVDKGLGRYINERRRKARG